ncbi:SusC/RagA family TonB-linked outer membrane protein [Flavobacterium granuli]|uniref:TonB-linked SusC/RagA family outer membrane protein n=1 Tax=Flavobacterium granuli TaxID=280093 RepID=A0A1M5TW18_9FLAO|nr:SusC/RagA family TonB-linked outer membrane protein [Flavobacterium granuli]PRZ22875.1 TonB-linked SusC/RagA family outer membrane protein [Flavobacterium granuli]SHH54851.1 TonB-linked outer membrane protein, SusC/RagA family [Flavobacterium granuli]
MKKSFLISFLFLLVQTTFAQTKTITGTVKNKADGIPIPGATVLIKGTATSTTTDFDGKFAIKAISSDILSISFIGFETKEVKITSSSMNIILTEGVQSLKEIVIVGSMGRTLDKSSLGYAAQAVKGQEIADTQRSNFANALQGRIAGLTVTSSTGAPGASSAIQLRGVNSLSGNNTPLYIVDGLPVSNETLDQGLMISNAPNRNQDYTNRGADINPEDIESITILKGPEAAALYGMQAGNGAIVITTKKGRKGVGRVSYSTNTRLDQIYRFPETQKVYQRGSGGITNTDYRRQFGEAFTPGTKLYDNIGDFFKIGTSTTHNLSFEAGTETSSYRLSLSNLNQEGITPNTSYDRLTASLNATAKISPKFKSEGTFSFTKSENQKASKGGSGGLTGSNGYLLTLLGWPQNLDVRDYLNIDGTRKKITSGALDTETDNPFWDVNKNLSTDWNNRFVSNVGLIYDPASWLNFTARVGWDVNSGQGFRAIHPESAAGTSTGGFIETYYNSTSNLNSTFLGTANKSFGKFNTKIMVGNAINDNYFRILSTSGSKYFDPNFNSINNTDATTQRSQERIIQSRIIGFFTELNLDYDKIVFLSLTGRKDWVSVLPDPFFYPSASSSFMFTNLPGLKDKNTLSYGKIRASYAEAANIPSPYSAVPVFQPQLTTNGGYAYGVTGANPNLIPEFRKSFEFGTELKFFNDRLGLDVTVYSTKTVDPILKNMRLSYGTGFVLTSANFGDLRNEGLEITLNSTPVKTTNFSWDMSANFNKTRSELLNLPDAVTEYYLSDTWLYNNVRGGVKVGNPLTTITAVDYLKNNSGQILVDPSTGYPLKDPNFIIAGDRNPDFVIGFQNTFKYKNLSLSVLLDIRKGGDIFNGTEFWMYQNGISTRTLDREQPRVVQGVLRDGLENSATPTQNNIAVTPYLQNEYYRSGAVDADFIEKDINWLRMRDITLSYRMPSETLQKTAIKSLSFNITMTDAFMITNYTGADPAVNGLNASAGGAGGVGFDFGTVSTPRGLNIGVKLGF